VRPIIEAVTVLLQLWDQLASEGIELSDLDIGGGLGIPYGPEDHPEGPDALAAGLRPLLAGRKLNLALEPGRFLVGPAGTLLTTVLYTKQTQGEDGTSRTLAIVDAGMNDLLRPALYGAWHPVWPLHEADLGANGPVDLVGPVCESSDILAQDRCLGQVRPGNLLAIGQAGAYGYSMSSNYNARPRLAEVLVEGTKARLIRKRETYADFVQNQ
jgi:diaminopimelate decarboxylase